MRTLDVAGAELLGVMVTMMPTKGPDSYSYGAYGAYGAYDGNDAELSDTDSISVVQKPSRLGKRGKA